MRWYHIPVIVLGLAALTWLAYMIFQGAIELVLPWGEEF